MNTFCLIAVVFVFIVICRFLLVESLQWKWSWQTCGWKRESVGSIFVTWW